MSALRKPIPEDDFLETQAGQDWLSESVDDLLSRRDVEAPNPVGRNQVLVSADHLPEALADHMAAHADPDHCIEKILIELVRREDDSLLHRWAVRAVGGDPLTVRSMAVGLITVHANEYRDAKCESDRVELECGF